MACKITSEGLFNPLAPLISPCKERHNVSNHRNLERAMRLMRISILLASALVLASCGQSAETASTSTKGPAQVDGARIVSADSEPGNWLSVGRTYSEQRFSPLDEINDESVQDLGLAWSFDLDTARGQEATPLVVDGVMYFSTAWSMVKALDAKTGALKWAYDPKVPREHGVKVCCDVVNRGVAIWNGKIYVGTIDGRLVALDAANGQLVWSVQTTDATKPYSITGAVRVVKGKVLIGNSGAEFGVRGYISAYDAESGALAWRFYTVPGQPGQKDGAASDKALAEIAAPTWNGEYWTAGGGGTVWDAIVYDPELDLLYFGVGNGSPWTQGFRGKMGDNLFLVSVVAVRPDTGEYVWHYQEVPGDEWDYTSVQPIILADLPINGETRKVLMHAPKNGFFYVLDRATGELLSAQPFSRVTWASGIDMKTGRPIEHPDARYSRTGKPWSGFPGPQGAHNWNPMAFSPATGLVYIPAQELGSTYVQAQTFAPRPLGFNTGLDRAANALSNDPAAIKAAMDAAKGYLLAWDPVNQKEVWRVEHRGPANGGVLATAGNLVLQGTYGGEFAVYRADNGEKLWSMPVQTSVIAAPMTYMVDGEQYIAVLAGTGGAYALTPGVVSLKSGAVRNVSRVLAFKLGGNATLPQPPQVLPVAFNPPPLTATAATIANGFRLYTANCGVCHGAAAVSGGIVPDLRSSPFLADDGYFDIVLGGSLKARGMVSFAEVINRDEAEAIRAYVISRALETRTAAAPAP
jgi:alcohol dehydrogenase (cytochrome c)/quinohemoprotein ethanol dehydrogenase